MCHIKLFACSWVVVSSFLSKQITEYNYYKYLKTTDTLSISIALFCLHTKCKHKYVVTVVYLYDNAQPFQPILTLAFCY